MIRDDAGSSQAGVMGDSLPEEPEACIVYPGHFAPSTCRVLNHRYVSFRANPQKMLHMSVWASMHCVCVVSVAIVLYNSTCRSAVELSKHLLIKILRICQRDSGSQPKQAVSPVSSEWTGRRACTPRCYGVVMFRALVNCRVL